MSSLLPVLRGALRRLGKGMAGLEKGLKENEIASIAHQSINRDIHTEPKSAGDVTTAKLSLVIHHRLPIPQYHLRSHSVVRHEFFFDSTTSFSV